MSDLPPDLPPDLPDDVAAAVSRFVLDHPELAGRDGAFGACEWASRRFARRCPGAVPLFLRGCRTSFPKRAAFYRGYRNPDPELYHVAVRAGDWGIDLTRRQFDPRGPHPYVRPIAEFVAEWLLASPSRALIDACMFIDAAEMQADPAWIRKAYPRCSPAEREAMLAKQVAALATARRRRDRLIRKHGSPAS